MADYLSIKPTVQNLQIFDYGLNILAHSIPVKRVIKEDGIEEIVSNKWGIIGSRAVQALSYITHPVDLGIQALAYPLLRTANPFITVGVDLCNKNFGKAIGNTFLIPFKLFFAVPKTIFFEAKQLTKLGWSILGFNTLVNIVKGKNQATDFFAKRLQRFENVKAKNIIREENLQTQKSIGYIFPWADRFSPPDATEKVMKAEQIIAKNAALRTQQAENLRKAKEANTQNWANIKQAVQAL